MEIYMDDKDISENPRYFEQLSPEKNGSVFTGNKKSPILPDDYKICSYVIEGRASPVVQRMAALYSKNIFEKEVKSDLVSPPFSALSSRDLKSCVTEYTASLKRKRGRPPKKKICDSSGRNKLALEMKMYEGELMDYASDTSMQVNFDENSNCEYNIDEDSCKIFSVNKDELDSDSDSTDLPEFFTGEKHRKWEDVNKSNYIVENELNFPFEENNRKHSPCEGMDRIKKYDSPGSIINKTDQMTQNTDYFCDKMQIPSVKQTDLERNCKFSSSNVYHEEHDCNFRFSNTFVKANQLDCSQTVDDKCKEDSSNSVLNLPDFTPKKRKKLSVEEISTENIDIKRYKGIESECADNRLRSMTSSLKMYQNSSRFRSDIISNKRYAYHSQNFQKDHHFQNCIKMNKDQRSRKFNNETNRENVSLVVVSDGNNKQSDSESEKSVYAVGNSHEQNFPTIPNFLCNTDYIGNNSKTKEQTPDSFNCYATPLKHSVETNCNFNTLDLTPTPIYCGSCDYKTERMNLMVLHKKIHSPRDSSAHSTPFTLSSISTMRSVTTGNTTPIKEINESLEGKRSLNFTSTTEKNECLTLEKTDNSCKINMFGHSLTTEDRNTQLVQLKPLKFYIDNASAGGNVELPVSNVLRAEKDNLLNSKYKSASKEIINEDTKISKKLGRPGKVTCTIPNYVIQKTSNKTETCKTAAVVNQKVVRPKHLTVLSPSVGDGNSPCIKIQKTAKSGGKSKLKHTNGKKYIPPDKLPGSILCNDLVGIRKKVGRPKKLKANIFVPEDDLCSSDVIETDALSNQVQDNEHNPDFGNKILKSKVYDTGNTISDISFNVKDGFECLKHMNNLQQKTVYNCSKKDWTEYTEKKTKRSSSIEENHNRRLKQFRQKKPNDVLKSKSSKTAKQKNKVKSKQFVGNKPDARHSVGKSKKSSTTIHTFSDAIDDDILTYDTEGNDDQYSHAFHSTVSINSDLYTVEVQHCLRSEPGISHAVSVSNDSAACRSYETQFKEEQNNSDTKKKKVPTATLR